MQLSAAESVPRFDARYPAPPEVPWGVLFGLIAAVNLACRFFLHTAAASFFPALVMSTWALYLCSFLRTLNPKAASLYWVIGSWLCYGVLIFLYLLPQRTALINLGILVYVLLAAASGLVSIYVIRYELMKHYNEVEPCGLKLGGIMTFFFSYIYFQYYLCGIAEMKRQEASTLTA